MRLTIDIDEVIVLIDKLIQQYKGNSLSSIQKAVLKGTIEPPRKNYGQIACEHNYSETYIKHFIAPGLWKLLSEIIGEKINRTNCSKQLNNFLQKIAELENQTVEVESSKLSSQTKFILEAPEGQVPLNSSLYINRGSLESSCYQTILEPSAFLCINAPRKMGKTSLMARILQYGAARNYYTIRLSLNQVESQLFSDTAKFMRWFYTNIITRLNLASELNRYWDEELGILVSCTIALEESVLKKLHRPLILAVDEINQLWEYPTLARDFFALLRHWYEKSKDVNIWQKLRFILIMSSEAYVPINNIFYPLNIGKYIELSPFNREEITELIQAHQMETTDLEINKLIEITGGFPYLVRLALYQSKLQNLCLESILSHATTNTGIYAKHLYQKSWQLKQNYHLFTAFLNVIKDPKPKHLDIEIKLRLKNLGLVHLEDDRIRVSCGLYREYFRSVTS